MSGIDRIEQLLQLRSDTDGTWWITSDELSDIFEPVEFYRATFEAGVLGVDRFDPENGGELIMLLERLTSDDVRRRFRGAGLFLTQSDRLELTERLVRTVRTAVVVHTPEPDTFRSMLTHLRRYDVALHTYLSTYLDRDTLADRCAEEFVEIHRHRLAETGGDRSAASLFATARVYLRLLFQRHVVEVEALAPGLMEILRTVARHEGFLPRGRRAREEEAESRRRSRAGHGVGQEFEDEEDRRRRALRVLGLATDQLSKREIQSRYRELMRRYHPDINPDGLEQAKEINNAYGILVSGR